MRRFREDKAGTDPSGKVIAVDILLLTGRFEEGSFICGNTYFRHWTRVLLSTFTQHTDKFRGRQGLMSPMPRMQPSPWKIHAGFPEVTGLQGFQIQIQIQSQWLEVTERIDKYDNHVAI
jgi:hypothetical protein